MEVGRRDLRRGGINRFSNKQSGSTKSKKRMLKKHETSYDFPASDLENKVFMKKLPKKDINGETHVSVPRKLRSAMKKRNLESVSNLSSKRLNRSQTGIEIEAKAISISKDEKEVAETLAGMFTSDEKETVITEPVVSVLSSDKTKQIDETPLMGLSQSSTVQSGSHAGLKSSSTKLPSWMGQAISSSKNGESLRVHPGKLKKCATHVYISNLIKVLQNSKNSPATVHQIEQRFSDPVTTMFSQSRSYQSQQLLDLRKTCNPKPVEEDRTQLSLELFGPQSSSQKQSYDFLSLSFAGPSQSHFPQNPTSATSSHQVHQISPYLATRFQTAYNANQQQQQHLQKLLRTAQFRPTTIGNTTPPLLNQYSKPNLTLNLTNIQPLHVASSPRYNNSVSQQQHRLMAAMSMNHHHHSRMVMNRQEHKFPVIYEDSRTPLQLLYRDQT